MLTPITNIYYWFKRQSTWFKLVCSILIFFVYWLLPLGSGMDFLWIFTWAVIVYYCTYFIKEKKSDNG